MLPPCPPRVSSLHTRVYITSPCWWCTAAGAVGVNVSLRGVCSSFLPPPTAPLFTLLPPMDGLNLSFMILTAGLTRAARSLHGTLCVLAQHKCERVIANRVPFTKGHKAPACTTQAQFNIPRSTQRSTDRYLKSTRCDSS